MLVDEKDLLKQAAREGYAVCAFEVPGIELLGGVIEAAERLRAPIILTLSQQRLAHVDIEHFLPAMEAAGQGASVPVAIRFTDVTSAESAVRAIGLGCNSIAPALADGSFDRAALMEELAAIADGCGVALAAPFPEADRSILSHRMDVFAAERLVQAAATSIDYSALMSGMRQAVSGEAERRLLAAGAAGRAEAALAACRPWAPVEHVILFNVSPPQGEPADEHAAALMRDGRDILGAIPGVRRVFVGTSVKADSRYRHCWLVRFVHPRVIDSYRDHPDHVAFADERFRPVAGDRVSIDFEEI
jgi:fructose-bisphosphate aldolase class II